MFKKAGLITSLLAAIALPIAAHATAATTHSVPLSVFNNTGMYSVLKIVSFNTCSASFGDIGIGNPGETKVIPTGMLDIYCAPNPTSCVADLYLSSTKPSPANGCDGAPVGRVTFNVYTGVISGNNGRVTIKSPNLVEID